MSQSDLSKGKPEAFIKLAQQAEISTLCINNLYCFSDIEYSMNCWIKTREGVSECSYA